MAGYIAKRLAMTGLVVVIIATFLATVIHLVGGNPAEAVLGPRATPELVAQARAQMHLDEPIYLQVWHFLAGVVHGDLGQSFLSSQPVTVTVFQALPHTLALAFSGLGLAAILGIPLGAYAATRAGSFGDRVTGVVSTAIIATPSYVVALYLLLLFVLQWSLFPAIATAGFDDPLLYAWELALPAASLGLIWTGYIARIVRASMLEVTGSDYVRTAWAFGLRRRTVYYRYALKNAVLPAVAALVFAIGELLGSAVFVELIFSRQGLGRVLVDAIGERDFPVVRGAVLVIAVIYMMTNLIADLSYRFLDPRIRVEEADA